MGEIVIRFATLNDAAIIADMSRNTFVETFAADNTEADMQKFLGQQFTYENLYKEVTESNGIFLLAHDGDDAVGYARMRESILSDFPSGISSIEIARIYAVQSSIGKGVGKALMQHCINIAIDMKKDLVWLGVWEKNLRAINFYKKFGFEKFGEHPFLLGDDEQTDWLMKKELH